MLQRCGRREASPRTSRTSAAASGPPCVCAHARASSRDPSTPVPPVAQHGGESAQDGFLYPHQPREEGVRPRSVPTAQVPGRGSGPLQIPGDDGQSIASLGHQAGHRPADAPGASEHGAHLVHLGRGAAGPGEEATRDGPSQRPRKFTQRGALKLNRGPTALAAVLEPVRAQKPRAPRPVVNTSERTKAEDMGEELSWEGLIKSCLLHHCHLAL